MATRYAYEKPYHAETGVADFLPYSTHVTRHTVQLTTRDYLQVIRLEGIAHESADIASINIWHDQLNLMMRNIASPQIALWTHVVRRDYWEYPAGDYPPGFAHDFNEQYRQHVARKRMRINQLYLAFLYRPDRQDDSVFSFLGGGRTKARQRLRQHQQDDLTRLEDTVGVAIEALERYSPQRLGCYTHNGALFSELLEFLGYLVNGEWHRMPVPRGEIRYMLPTTRPLFGKGGLMTLLGGRKPHYAAMLAIQEYPNPTVPGLLDDVLELPMECVLTQSFTFLSKGAAVGRMARQKGRMENAGELAVSQVHAIDQALDELVSNEYVMGAHHLTLLVRGESGEAVADHVNAAGSALADAGIKWVREDIGLAASYWSQLPGNFTYRVRVGDITSRNFAGFASLHNYPIGRIRDNQWGDAVMVLHTASGNPYYFNFHKAERHERIDQDQKDPANTLIIGQTGSGKTVLMNTLLSMAQKYHRPPGHRASFVVFDKDRGASIAIRALGGHYYPIATGVPSGLAPFQLDPTPDNKAFLQAFVKKLVTANGEQLSAVEEQQIYEAIRGVLAAPRSMRRLGSLLEFFDATDETGLHIRLARWCKGGPLGWLFDNDQDLLDLTGSNIVGFDVTEFLDNPETRTPVVMYLFQRVKQLIDGRRISIWIDEFWKALADEYFEDFANNYLKTIRKMDGFLVMATQSPRDALRSPISHTLIEQTVTKIFLPNPSADRDDYVEGFKLSEREYQIIRNFPEKSRRFLIKQGQNAIIGELNLKGFEDTLAVLSGNTDSALYVQRLIADYGEQPEQWLPKFYQRRRGS